MSNLAHKLQQEQQQRQQQTVKQKVLVRRKFKITLGEKLLGVMFIGMVVFGAIHLISSHVTLYEMNREIHALEVGIQNQTNVNRDLELKVAELNNYEHLLKKANELGLSLNTNNVRNVRD